MEHAISAITASAAAESSTRPRHLTLIDGSGFIFRAFFAMPGFSKRDGTPTGAVYGFVNMMLKLNGTYSYSKFQVCIGKRLIKFKSLTYS
mgnify:CR=1 FL=1